jgi:chromosome segregation ATPase
VPSEPGIYPLTMEEVTLRRAFLRGYKRADVELALARSTIARERVQLELEAVRLRADDLQREVEDARAQIADHRRRETELLAALDEVRERRESLEREARLKADEIVADAREKAAGLRTEGLREVGELQEHVEQLLGLRAGLTATLKRTMHEIGGALERLAGGRGERLPDPPVLEPAAEAEPEPEHDDLDSALSPFSADSER